MGAKTVTQMMNEQNQNSVAEGRSDLEGVVMPDEPIECVECKLPGGRSITVFPAGDESFMFLFVNNGHETTLKLSTEAVQAMHSLWFELRARGLAA